MSVSSVPSAWIRRSAALAPATTRSEWAASISKNSRRWGMRALNIGVLIAVMYLSYFNRLTRVAVEQLASLRRPTGWHGECADLDRTDPRSPVLEKRAPRLTGE